ncbi:MAG TPA: family 20 glycosylhydrolase [Pyrinomonadaceae bacterium]|nr:family 20 glycosylhydrolase [Pyrinomonadaceae bacterium]
MKRISLLALILICVPLVVCGKQKPWRAIHLLDYNTDADLVGLGQNLEALAKQGINVIVLEVDYNFEFKSHPELRRGTTPITREGARKFAALCKKLGIRLIPQFQAVGHQSWKADTFPLLTKYPQFDLTPGAFPNNEGIYCREWDVLNPEVWRIVFQLMDEIIDAFRADAFHVGMDEVFLLGSEKSPSTKGKDPGVLFANAVKELHNHLVRKRRVEMLMWGDRLIDAAKYDYGEWEAAKNGTAPAIDLIPKDIIICDWHYEVRSSYPSIPMFIEKGFRVVPAGWKDVEATKAFINYSRSQTSSKMLGYMFTTWSVKKDALLAFPPLVEGTKLLRE